MRILPPPVRASIAPLVVCSLVTLAAIAVWHGVPAAAVDECALPAQTAALAPAAQAELARHTMACRDLVHGRITRDDYRRLLGALPQASSPLATLWASSVLAVSSQYSADSWSARQVLGPPDVYPGFGDNGKAWASRDADAGDEFIEVGFAQPMPLRELQIYETFNPGAVASIDATTVSGRHIVLAACGGTFIDGACDAPRFVPAEGAQIARVPLTCGEAIASVRVRLASGAVPGWNELDAIGGVPCATE